MRLSLLSFTRRLLDLLRARRLVVDANLINQAAEETGCIRVPYGTTVVQSGGRLLAALQGFTDKKPIAQ